MVYVPYSLCCVCLADAARKGEENLIKMLMSHTCEDEEEDDDNSNIPGTCMMCVYVIRYVCDCVLFLLFFFRISFHT